MRLGSRKVMEIKQKLIMAVTRRILVANELKSADLEIEWVEHVDGTKPSLLIRIKAFKRKGVVSLGGRKLTRKMDKLLGKPPREGFT